MCARDLARYTHPPMAPKEKPFRTWNCSPPVADRVIPTPRAVSEAFHRAKGGAPLALIALHLACQYSGLRCPFLGGA